ncbi:cyclic nucleotide-binding domain-containing protein, partial [Streptomyces sp. NPDC005568]|uniref:cyclic nucleotide-binding domain-containing protein n=1 Tax=Streptomyces sp. NPDC005568 TaxID=3156887 RepID=UPI0033B71DE1
MDDVLRRAPLFAALDDEQAAELRASMSEVTLARGDALFHEGDPGDRLYVVTEGKVKLHRTSPDGRENMLAPPARPRSPSPYASCCAPPVRRSRTSRTAAST